MKAPFPWFGGKSRVSEIVWPRFGNVKNYIEPFFGSGAMLLSRPTPPGIETVNDLDRFVANFWRATVHDAEAVSHYCDWPVNEADLHARHEWIMKQKREWFDEKMHTDPDFYDVKIAAWWVWGISSWIGSNWCEEKTKKSVPHIGNSGNGIHSQSRQRPHIRGSGSGIHAQSRQRPHISRSGKGINRKSANIDYFLKLQNRLRNVRVCCGDWKRVLGPAVYSASYPCGIFLDTPYSAMDRDSVYSVDSFTVAHDVRDWCLENGNDSRLRIALCGYESEHDSEMAGWTKIKWKAAGGYGNYANAQGMENKLRECIWFSPHCLQSGLFD